MFYNLGPGFTSLKALFGAKTIYSESYAGWITAILGPFDSISVISGMWKADNERLRAMAPH